ncbi:MAG TPA: hypothetical protein VFB81_04335 [Myxococcales bacterium]|nr:hypothetical protein [Myxococcales bacterium]
MLSLIAALVLSQPSAEPSGYVVLVTRRVGLEEARAAALASQFAAELEVQQAGTLGPAAPVGNAADCAGAVECAAARARDGRRRWAVALQLVRLGTDLGVDATLVDVGTGRATAVAAATGTTEATAPGRALLRLARDLWSRAKGAPAIVAARAAAKAPKQGGGPPAPDVSHAQAGTPKVSGGASSSPDTPPGAAGTPKQGGGSSTPDTSRAQTGTPKQGGGASSTPDTPPVVAAVPKQGEEPPPTPDVPRTVAAAPKQGGQLPPSPDAPRAPVNLDMPPPPLLRAPPAPVASPSPGWPPGRVVAVSAGGASVVAAGAGTYFGISALVQYQQLRSSDPNYAQQRTDMLGTARVADVAFGAAALLAGTAVVTWLLTPEPAAHP